MRAFHVIGVLAAIASVASIASPAAALADDGEPVSTHKGQFGLSARLGVGVRAIATYDRDVFCGSAVEDRVCTGRSPMSLDLEAAYGIRDSIELTFELRVGLESDFGSTPGGKGPRPFHIAPGARFFFSEAKRTKLFVQPSLVFDFASYGQREGNDFGVRGIEGLWIDLHRSYGAYVYVAETIEFSRWLSGGFEAGIGFQGRYP
jgi:hypothetical protein